MKKTPFGPSKRVGRKQEEERRKRDARETKTNLLNEEELQLRREKDSEKSEFAIKSITTEDCWDEDKGLERTHKEVETISTEENVSDSTNTVHRCFQLHQKEQEGC